MGLELLGKISLDGSGFENGIRRLERTGEHAFERIKELAVEAFGVATVAMAVKKTIEYGDHIVDMARRTGVGVEALQEIGYAAKQNGAELEDLISLIEKLNKNRIDPQKAGDFAKLGIDASDLKNLKVEDLIMKISAGLQGRSSQELTGPILSVGGKGAGNMIIMLKDDMEELRQEAQRLGLVMRTQDAVMLKYLSDEMMVLAQTIVVGLAPALNYLIQQMLFGVNKIKAAGTFWGDFSGRGGFTALFNVLKYFSTAGVALFQQDGLKKAKENFAELNKIFTESGRVSEQARAEMDEKTKAQVDELLRKQNEIERINSMPDFQSVMDDPKASKGTRLGNGDAWRQVGAFMTGSSDLIVDIGREQVRKLGEIEKQLITLNRFNERNQSRGTFGVPAT